VLIQPFTRTCALCRSAPPIQNSHIVPNFVVKRLKRGTPIQGLIHSTDPTSFEQDSWKGPYLCKVCEQSVSKLEAHFAATIYTPLLTSGLVSLTYDDRVARFLASVHFRYLTFVEHKAGAPLPTDLERLRSALRDATMGGLAAAPGASLYMAPLYPVRTPVYPPGVNHYFFEAIDAAQFPWINPTEQWISYVKFPNLALFAADGSLGRILSDPELITEHEIADSGELVYAPSADPPAILEIVRDRIERIAAEVQANYGLMSDRQTASIQAQIDRHPDAESTRAHATYQMDRDLLQAWERR
jgi:hypothetical protein